jgi:hypothetical protein
LFYYARNATENFSLIHGKIKIYYDLFKFIVMSQLGDYELNLNQIVAVMKNTAFYVKYQKKSSTNVSAK